MMKKFHKKQRLLSAVLGMTVSCSAGGVVDAAVNYQPDPPGSVMAETGEASYIVTELTITGNKHHSTEEIKLLCPTPQTAKYFLWPDAESLYSASGQHQQNQPKWPVWGHIR